MSEAPKESHPSYGKVQISRVQGGIGAMFGSSIQHHDCVALRIKTATIERDLSNDWIFDGDDIIEVYLSPVQFAELLTTTGTGVPCTITWMKGVGNIERPPFVDKAEQFRDEFKKSVQDMVDEFKNLAEFVEEAQSAKTVSKTTLKTVASLVNRLHAQLVCNLPFINQQFRDQMEKTVAEAKAAIDASQIHKALVFAQEGMKFVENLGNDEPQPMVILE